MASIQFGGGITNAVGSHSGNTFARNKGGAYFKKKPHGTNPNSQSQTLHRTRVGQLAKEWNYRLSDSERIAWNVYASTTPVINRLGNTGFLSGQQMFLKLSAPIIGAGFTNPTSPPVTGAVGTVTAISVTAVSGGGGSLHVNATATSLTADDIGVVFVTPPLSPGRFFVSSQFRKHPGSISLNISQDITGDYITLFGQLPTGPGQVLFVRIAILNKATGIQSAAMQQEGLWT